MKTIIIAFIGLLSSVSVYADVSEGTVHVTGNLLAPTCSITGGTDITFNLDTVSVSDLPDVNSTAGKMEKEISLTCDADTQVYMTIDGCSSTDNDSVIVNTGTAQGVGIQLLDVTNNNNPIHIGQRWNVIAHSTESESIPIAAQYYRLGSLTAGTVKATATYTLDYE